MKSLQVRLLLGLAIGTSLVLICAGVVLQVLIRAELIEEFDATLASEARALATLVEDHSGRLETEMAEHGVPKFQSDSRPVYYQLWNAESHSVEKSRDLGSHDLPRFGGTLNRPQWRVATLPGPRAGRVVGIRFVPHREDLQQEQADSGPGTVATIVPAMNRDMGAVTAEQQRGMATLVVACGTSELEKTLGRIRALLGGVFGGAVVIVLVVTAPIVRASLSPLAHVSDRIRLLDSHSLSERLDSAEAPVEIRSVTDCLNGLLDRLHDAFQRERAFSANVAHELRTPLAGLRSTLEVALLRPREAHEYDKSLAQCLAICKQAEVLTENLLALARLDSGECQLRRENIDLERLLRAIWSPLAAHAEEKGLQVTWQLNCQHALLTDSAMLTLIMRNLLENAVSYANDQGQVEIHASMVGDNTRIVIRNSANGLPADVAERASDRFWRADASRSETGSHAGIGLSLCREAVRVLGGNLSIEAGTDHFAALCMLTPLHAKPD